MSLLQVVRDHPEVLKRICSFSAPRELCRLSRSHSAFRYCRTDEVWKPLAVKEWSELAFASEVEKDPFPAWKNLYARKSREPKCTLQDVASSLGDCDWYSCPNGHLYVIGECRLPMRTGRCPTCKAKIGGASHARLADNRRVGRVKDRALVETGKAMDISFEQIETLYRDNALK
jgi:hypothetical protein